METEIAKGVQFHSNSTGKGRSATNKGKMHISKFNVGENLGSGEANNFNNGEPNTALVPAAKFGRLGVDVNQKDAQYANRQSSKGVSPVQGHKSGTVETRTYSNTYTSNNFGTKESKNSIPRS